MTRTTPTSSADHNPRTPVSGPPWSRSTTNLPTHLCALTLPLADAHLLLLQRVPFTPRFSLLTILDLPACPHLTDTSIVSLSPLHSLVALDASATSLSSYAIKALAGTLLWVDDGPERRGPWPLRILRLRYCTNMDDNVYHHLSRFPLLSVIDLRGTNCRPAKDSAFQPSSDTALFHPSPLAAAVDSLSGLDLCSSENRFNLVVDTLNHPLSKAPGSIAIPQESYVFVPSSRVKPKSKKDASSGDLQLQPPRKEIIVPKANETPRWASEEDAFGSHYNCECNYDYTCNACHDSGSEEGFDSDRNEDDDSDEDDESDAADRDPPLTERFLYTPPASPSSVLAQPNRSLLQICSTSIPFLQPLLRNMIQRRTTLRQCIMPGFIWRALAGLLVVMMQS
ncbi:hypothetical protein FPV67DRAFT_22896 [Lyophyllum atratum]|nr:hypothetical protein FPV67DRAFT_22896 [Lyophyllum atratum]